MGLAQDGRAPRAFPVSVRGGPAEEPASDRLGSAGGRREAGGGHRAARARGRENHRRVDAGESTPRPKKNALHVLLFIRSLAVSSVLSSFGEGEDDVSVFLRRASRLVFASKSRR